MTEALEGFERLVIDHSGRGPASADQLREWNIRSLPTLVFLDVAGEEVARMNGAPPEQLVATARRASAAATR